MIINPKQRYLEHDPISPTSSCSLPSEHINAIHLPVEHISSMCYCCPGSSSSVDQWTTWAGYWLLVTSLPLLSPPTPNNNNTRYLAIFTVWTPAVLTILDTGDSAGVEFVKKCPKLKVKVKGGTKINDE